MRKKRYQSKSVPQAVIAKDSKRGRISHITMTKSNAIEASEIPQFQRYEPPKGVIPEDQKESVLAMDRSPYDYMNQGVFNQHYVEYRFPGYPVLSNWAQLPEYRKMSETIAKEMTRKWIKITSRGDGGNKERVNQLIKAVERYKLQDKFRTCAEYDGFFGRGQLFVDLKAASGNDIDASGGELATPLILDSKKIPKGSLKGFNPVEPVWTYPGEYNANNPLRDDFYRPAKWFVMGLTVHSSRLLPFVSREVPDLLKASYNFGGMSLSQLARPYVENWIRTRDSIGDLIHSFSINGIKTDMSAVLGGVEGADAQFFDRAELFNNLRDNRGLMLLDKDGEEFFQFNTPLSSLDKLQAQAQEQQSSVCSIPLVKLFGITPSGLNASSDGEIKVFYDFIRSMQEHLFTDNLIKCLKIIQLSEFGDIDEDISFEFETLHEPDAIEAATIRKTNAETDSILINDCRSISPEESRARVASDPESGYNGIDVDAEIEPPEDEGQEETE